jgi:hypothetical protein
MHDTPDVTMEDRRNQAGIVGGVAFPAHFADYIGGSLSRRKTELNNA